jgi:hypothetical protein
MMCAPVAALFVCFLDIKFGTILPSPVDNTVMMTSAERAPERTIDRGCLIAINAAMMKVSSPICHIAHKKFLY